MFQPLLQFINHYLQFLQDHTPMILLWVGLTLAIASVIGGVLTFSNTAYLWPSFFGLAGAIFMMFSEHKLETAQRFFELARSNQDMTFLRPPSSLYVTLFTAMIVIAALAAYLYEGGRMLTKHALRLLALLTVVGWAITGFYTFYEQMYVDVQRFMWSLITLYVAYALVDLSVRGVSLMMRRRRTRTVKNAKTTGRHALNTKRVVTN